MLDLRPNCGGNFESRRIRPTKLLDKNPASTKRLRGSN